jgi:drug/metabolite transporter (DMT)-like permease
VTAGGLLFAIALNLALGSTYFATRMALDGLPPLTIVLVRTLAAAAVLLPFAEPGALRPLLAPRGGSLGAVLTMGVAGYALPLVLGNFGVARSSATNGALLIGVEPITVALLGALVLGERLGPLRALALALGLAGATTIVANGIPLVTVTYTPHLVGDLLLVAHGAAWAIYSIAGKPLLGRHPPVAVTAAGALVAIPAIAPFAAAELAGVTWGPAAWSGLAWAAGLGVLASGLGGLGWNVALRRMDASQLAAFVFLQPIAGVALGALALGEPVTAWALLGGALVFGGVHALVAEERARR